MTDNLLLMTDSYKVSHYMQYPDHTEFVSSYIESRGGKWDKTVFFGLQMFIKKYLLDPITLEDIDEAAMVWEAHGEPFNREGWMHILNNHDGYLPIEIEALPEGTIINTRECLVQLVNTDRHVPWLTSFMETALLRAIWYPTTVATNSYACKTLIWDVLERTADDPASELPFKMHDFGARGVSSAESAAIGGAAHLVNFVGTDNIEGCMAARKYYGEHMAGFSIPASEHSTITSWGSKNEVKAFENMIDKYGKPGAIFACVSDSYDIYAACSDLWGTKLKNKLINSGSTLVVRPDSGDPVMVPVDCIELLMQAFGETINSKGYRVLPDYVRVIQGDGIDVDTVSEIYAEMIKRNLSASNIAFGQGGGLLQQLNRDTLKFAMKCSAIKINGTWNDVYKDPITDQGKQSKRGRLAVVKVDGEFTTVAKTAYPVVDNEMQIVFRNGRLLVNDTFAAIRERANKEL